MPGLAVAMVIIFCHSDYYLMELQVLSPELQETEGYHPLQNNLLK